eukprot:5652854-Amphidinium_carterae.1
MVWLRGLGGVLEGGYLSFEIATLHRSSALALERETWRVLLEPQQSSSQSELRRTVDNIGNENSSATERV